MFLGFPGGSDGKESACNVRDLGSIPGLGRSLGLGRGGHGNPLQYSCLENPHGQRSLAGYSPWGHKELDVTERLSIYIYVYATFSLSVPLLIDIKAASLSWLLLTVLLCTLGFCVFTNVRTMVFSRYTSRSGIAGSHGSSV